MCRKLPIREIHLDKLLRELGIDQKEVRISCMKLLYVHCTVNPHQVPMVVQSQSDAWAKFPQEKH